jgi:hypothetical protein
LIPLKTFSDFGGGASSLSSKTGTTELIAYFPDILKYELNALEAD